MEEEEKLISEIREKVVKAEEDAKNLSANNNIVGRVTRYETVKVGERNYIGVDINFEDYVKSYI
ncbi:ATP-binding protein, partial [Sulfolobus sp. E5]